MNRRQVSFFMVSLSAVLLNACAVYRTAENGIDINFTESSENNVVETGRVYELENGIVDLEPVIELFFSKSIEEAAPYYGEKYGHYTIDAMELHVMRTADENMELNCIEASVMYKDEREGAGTCYQNIIGILNTGDYAKYTMRENLPQEDLDFCTKEEAIEACRPYAEVLGYEDAEVTVYAVTLDILEELAVPKWSETYYGAPGPGFELVTRDMIDEAYKAGDEKKVIELEGYRSIGASLRGIPWEKKHEVFVLTYQPYLEGFLMNETLRIIYSPLYGKPVLVNGEIPYNAVEVLEEKQLISGEEAAAETLMIKGYDSGEEITFNEISLIYISQVVKMDWELMKEIRNAIPCWSVEYIYEGKEYKILIDAINGGEYVI